MSITFYHSPMSTSNITQVVLAELAVPYETVNLDIKGGDTKKHDFLNVNPNGKVPVLVHDGSSIWESSAITMYLGETFGVEKNLWPAAGPKRGEAMKWVAWTNVTMGDAVARFTRNTMDWYPADQRNENAAAAAKKDVEHCLNILDKALEGKQFLVGEYTLADAHLNSFVGWLTHMNFDLTPYKWLTAWTARCNARPAVAKLMNHTAS